MNKWCIDTGIAFTPTFFVNGYQLPDIYKAAIYNIFSQNSSLKEKPTELRGAAVPQLAAKACTAKNQAQTNFVKVRNNLQMINLCKEK